MCIQRSHENVSLVVKWMEGRKRRNSKTLRENANSFQKLWHFADECELPKRDKSKGKEKMHMAQEDKIKEEESWLLMVLAVEHADVLLQGLGGSPIDDMWYLDMGASSHIIGMKTFY